MVFLLAIPFAVLAQDEDKPTFPLDNFYAKRKKNTVLKFLKDIHFGLSTGYGTTFLNHKLDGYAIYQRSGSSPGVFPVSPTVQNTLRFSNWVNNVAVDTVTTLPDLFRVSSDSAKLGFKGKAWNIPFRATLHYEFLKRFRIGGGYSYEMMFLGRYTPISYSDKLSGFKPNDSFGWMRKYFGMAGGSFYRTGNYLFTGDINIGGYNPGKNFNKSIIKRGIYYNVGITIERDFSEYLKAFIRPSFEIKKYTLTMPGAPAITHRMNAAYINIGLTYSIPELPRCYNKDCHVQMNHAHGDREYRSRVHKIWKWQNPGYGQNHPTLIKYKGKNKKKLSPY